jgi:hypothetical protein
VAVTRSFVDELDPDRRPTGTVASLRHRLSHPARLLTADQITPGTSWRSWTCRTPPSTPADPDSENARTRPQEWHRSDGTGRSWARIGPVTS